MTKTVSKHISGHALGSVFVDAIVVDQAYTIALVSENILQYLHFSMDEVKNKSINCLSGGNNLAFLLSRELEKGTIENFKARLYTKNLDAINVSISGGNFGLHIENTFIVLKIQRQHEADMAHRESMSKMTELDNFIYRAAHDLRGPLATIKGLINLLKIREDNCETDRLIDLLDAHANKLDDRLFKLVHLSQSESERIAPKFLVHFNELETSLRRLIEQNAFVDFLELLFTAPQKSLSGVNEVLLQGLLHNLLFHVLSLPLLQLDGTIKLDFETQHGELKITLTSEGFGVNSSINKIIEANELIYNEIMNFPQMVNFFKAQKIAWRLKAKVKAEFLTEGTQKIIITIPVKPEGQ